ncbi:MAG: zinc-binding alcohol dehydrogenase family protein [Proteobacteria bacterium]|nr:zinc-binding alcohol dehydrogenase family protein [Pseudomonadota bacterium]
MPKNEAAWLVAKHRPLEVRNAPYTEPGPHEIVVRNRAVAINPVDWAKPFVGDMMFSWIKYPFVLGSDLAGEVAAIGSAVTGFKPGDRVLAIAAGMGEKCNRAAESAFQRYTVVRPHLTTAIPDSMSFEDACVIPLGIVTAACGLFQSDLLALEKPGARPEPRDRWVIVWGGATSVGCNAIQLAVAAGYDVVTIASPKNHDYMRKLGAAHAFDYRSRSVERDIVATLKGKQLAGALAIGAGSVDNCVRILAQCEGRKFVANCSSPLSIDVLARGDRLRLGRMVAIVPSLVLANLRTRRLSRRYGIPAKFFDASSVFDNEIGPAIFRDYLGAALADGRFRPAPPPRVVGHGLKDIQKAFDIQRQGVSASKIVVTVD